MTDDPRWELVARALLVSKGIDPNEMEPAPGMKWSEDHNVPKWKNTEWYARDFVAAFDALSANPIRTAKP